MNGYLGLSASVAERYSGQGGDAKLEIDIKHARKREIDELIEKLVEEEGLHLLIL